MIGYTLRHRIRFLKYSVLGIVAFCFDLGLLYLFREMGTVPYYIAVPLSFFIATSVHYVVLRIYVFHDGARLSFEGYAYFLLIMVLNGTAVTLCVTGLVEFGGANLYLARTVVGGLVGFLSFFLNSRYNFKIL